jgi:hypothetical protein
VTTADLDRLATLAKAATHGPWEPYSGTSVVQSGPPIDKPLYYFSVDCFGPNPLEDAAYIAALDPTTVLDLIAMAREAERLRAWIGQADSLLLRYTRTHRYVHVTHGRYTDVESAWLAEVLTLLDVLAQPTGEATE